MISNLKNDISYGSNNNVNVTIVGRERLDEFPTYKESVTLLNGTTSYRFDEETYLSIFNNGWYGWWNTSNPDFKKMDSQKLFDYEYILNKFNLVARRNKNEFDEVWMISIDPVSAYETVMVGSTSYWVNGIAINKNCPNFIMSGFTISRVDSALECLGHASEQILKKVFTQSYDIYGKGLTIDKNKQNLWEKFTSTPYSVGFSEVGNVHFAPNSTKDYDWLNATYVDSAWIDWKNNYPNLTGQTVKTNYKTWNSTGNSYYDGRYYHRWWFSLMPHVSGRTNDGYSNNWWDYLYTFDFVKKITSNQSIYNYNIGDNISNITFKRTYNSNSVKNYTVVGNETNILIGNNTVIGYSNGSLKALKAGSTTIKCCFDGKCSSSTVVVKEIPTTPEIQGGNDNWSNIPVRISLKTPSAYSGTIKNYEYYISTSNNSLENGTWAVFNDYVNIAKNGTNYIYVRAVSTDSKYSKNSLPQMVKVDTQTPKTPSLEMVSNLKNVVKIKLKEKSEALSGIKEYQYYISTAAFMPVNGEWVKIDNSNDFSINKLGTYYVFVRAISNSGNISNTISPLAVTNILHEDPKEWIPVVQGGSENWSKENIRIEPTTPSMYERFVSTYECYISTSNTSLVNGNWHPFTTSIDINRNGISYVYVRAIMTDSTYSKVSLPQMIKIDKTNPEAPSLEVISQQKGITKIKLKQESEALSGIKEYQYYVSTSNTLENGEWKKISDSNDFELTQVGTYYVFARAISNSGVIGDISNYLKITNVAYEDPKEWIPEIQGGNDIWNSQAVRISVVTPSKYISEIKNYEYYISTSNTKLENGTWKTFNNFVNIDKNGINYIYIRAVTNDNNYSKNSLPKTIKIDNLKPKIPIIEIVEQKDGITKIKIKEKSEALSGIKEYQYYVSDSLTIKGNEWKTIDKSNEFSVADIGTYYIRIRALSNSGVLSDNSSPLIITNILSKDIEKWTPIIQGGNDIWNKEAIKLSIDTPIAYKNSIKNYEYYISTSNTKLENGVWKPFTDFVSIDKNGINYVYIRALTKDSKYSKNSLPVIVKIDNLKPKTPIIEIVEQKDEITKIKIKEKSEALSDIKEYQYYISDSLVPIYSEWIKIDNFSDFVVNKIGTYYIFVRALSNSEMVSDNSEPLMIVNEKPIEPIICNIFSNFIIENNDINVSEDVMEYQIKTEDSKLNFNITSCENVTYEVLNNENLKNNSLVTVTFKKDDENYNYLFKIIKKEDNKIIIITSIIIGSLGTITLSIWYLRRMLRLRKLYSNKTSI